MSARQIADLIPATMKRPDLVELLDALHKHGTKDQKSAAKSAKTNAQKRAAIVELAAQARRRRKVHALSLGFAFCKAEDGNDAPTLVELLTTPTTASGTVTCGRCRELLGVGELDAQAQAEEDAQVAEAEAETAKRRKREERKAAKDAAGTPATTSRGARANGTGDELGLDDGAGTRVEGDGLAIVYPYKGTDHTGFLKTTGEVLVLLAEGSELYRSPSRAAFAVTNSAVNGWARWRYTATDGQVYSIDRLRGNTAKPIRVGVTGRRPSKASAVARLEAGIAKADRLLARARAARVLADELAAKSDVAARTLPALEAAARALGADFRQTDEPPMLRAARSAAAKVSAELGIKVVVVDDREPEGDLFPEAERADVDLYPELGMFYAPASPDAFHVGQDLEVFDRGCWKRADVTEASDTQVTAAYVTGAGKTRVKKVDIRKVFIVNPYGRGLVRQGSTPDVEALKIRIPVVCRPGDGEELDLEAEARLDDVQVRDAEARGLNGVA